MEKSMMVEILLVEDNLDDIMIARRALKEAHVMNKLWVVRDGQEAVDFLKRQGQYRDREPHLPGLILLDLNLPKKNGLEVLEEIKGDSVLKRIPVVMLTVSKREEDIARGYMNGCNSYIQKPVEFDRFVEVVKQIGLYWGLLNELPGGAEQENNE